jgi:hypothetical protein
LVSFRAGGKRFFIVARGQGSLVSFGDVAMEKPLTKVSGLEFQWGEAANHAEEYRLRLFHLFHHREQTFEAVER